MPASLAPGRRPEHSSASPAFSSQPQNFDLGPNLLNGLKKGSMNRFVRHGAQALERIVQPVTRASARALASAPADLLDANYHLDANVIIAMAMREPPQPWGCERGDLFSGANGLLELLITAYEGFGFLSALEFCVKPSYAALSEPPLAALMEPPRLLHYIDPELLCLAIHPSARQQGRLAEMVREEVPQNAWTKYAFGPENLWANGDKLLVLATPHNPEEANEPAPETPHGAPPLVLAASISDVARLAAAAGASPPGAFPADGGAARAMTSRGGMEGEGLVLLHHTSLGLLQLCGGGTAATLRKRRVVAISGPEGGEGSEIARALAPIGAALAENPDDPPAPNALREQISNAMAPIGGIVALEGHDFALCESQGIFARAYVG